MTDKFEIRTCRACRLRYPLPANHPFGVRCPICMGETDVHLTQVISVEPPAQLETSYRHFAILLDNIRSAWNVGSILRTADGLGLPLAHLCGITPTPDQPEVRKTALGAEKSVAWSYHKDGLAFVLEQQKQGALVLALEQTSRSVAIQDASPVQDKRPVVLVLGNEISGVDPGILEAADSHVHINMRGSKRSFNVAIAFGIAAALLLQR